MAWAADASAAGVEHELIIPGNEAVWVTLTFQLFFGRADDPDRPQPNLTQLFVRALGIN